TEGVRRPAPRADRPSKERPHHASLPAAGPLPGHAPGAVAPGGPGPDPLATRVRAHPVPVRRRLARLAVGPPARPAGPRPRPLPLLPHPLRPGRPAPPGRAQTRRPPGPAAFGEARLAGPRPAPPRPRLAAPRPDPQPDRRIDRPARRVLPQPRPQVLP